jgi:hypothetical protein
MQTGGTAITKLIVVFKNFAKAPNKNVYKLFFTGKLS